MDESSIITVIYSMILIASVLNSCSNANILIASCPKYSFFFAIIALQQNKSSNMMSRVYQCDIHKIQNVMFRDFKCDVCIFKFARRYTKIHTESQRHVLCLLYQRVLIWEQFCDELKKQYFNLCSDHDPCNDCHVKMKSLGFSIKKTYCNSK